MRDPVFAVWVAASMLSLGIGVTVVAMTPAGAPPLVAAPDGGADGAAMMIAEEPTTRYAGESLAVDYEAVRGFVPGKPVLRSRP